MPQVTCTRYVVPPTYSRYLTVGKYYPPVFASSRGSIRTQSKCFDMEKPYLVQLIALRDRKISTGLLELFIVKADSDLISGISRYSSSTGGSG